MARDVESRITVAPMKLFAVYSASHEALKDEWFLPTLKDDYDVRPYRCDVLGEGTYMQDDWSRAILFKSATIINAIQDNWGEVFVYSDVDVTFFAPTEGLILESLRTNDIVCQLDDPSGNLCTGFLGIRANDATLALWQQVKCAVERERRDQPAFNRLVREMTDLRVGSLPVSFFGAGTFSGGLFRIGRKFHIPADPVMFHANFTVGVANKIALLKQARRIVGRGTWARKTNNIAVRLQEARTQDADAFNRPNTVALDVSTACQLKCPSCPTATGVIGSTIRTGVMRLADFKRFLDDHPWVSDIELSNWGEVFLNPDLEEILRHGYRRHVALRVDNGANLDRASDRVLEAVVKYKLRSLSCSIDGASQEVYSVYRVKGDFDRVISHIRRIVAFKAMYRSPYPALRWQFVAFGHNEHEIDKAREMARELGMEFYLKLSWDNLYTQTFSPVRNRMLIARQSEAGVADRQEYETKFGQSYVASTCHQLWLKPRINFDGRILGCSINHWDDFGNVFKGGLEASLRGEKMQRTRAVLMGLREADADSPCRRCDVYESRRRNNAWVRPEELVAPVGESALKRWLTNSVLHRPLSALAGRWRANLSAAQPR